MEIFTCSLKKFKLIFLFAFLLASPAFVYAKSIRIENKPERQMPIVNDEKIFLKLFKNIQLKVSRSEKKVQSADTMDKMPESEQVLAVQNLDE